MILLTNAIPVQAVVIDVSGVEFTSFSPNPIVPGQRPTLFGYAYDFNKETNATVSAGFSFSITLSVNAVLGDIVDDIPLGTSNGVASPLGGISGHSSGTTSNPNGITSFQVPLTTAPGLYHAFLAIALRSPHIDPDSDDAFGELSGLVTVVVPPDPHPGDFDDDGDIDGRDFLVWQRGGSPSPLSSVDLLEWQGNYGADGEADGDGDWTGETSSFGTETPVWVRTILQVPQSRNQPR